MAEPPKTSPPPTVDGMDGLYCQLVEIHAITAIQLAECARWRRSNRTSNAAYAGAGWQGPAMVPSMTRMVPPLLTDFSPQASLWQ
jgi:hypothetical protein